MSRPTLFCLHALGSSAREFDALSSAVSDVFDVVAVDLAGFGGSPIDVGVTVDDMVRDVENVIAQARSNRWMLVGHSMGGKVASLVAARSLAGDARLFGLAGVVLLAASPPSPEPMEDDRRSTMLAWAARGRLGDAAAREFVDANVGAPLTSPDDVSAIGDVLRTSREAWIAWLARGSREDHSAEVGTLDIPAVLVAGGADGDLNEEAQRRLNAPHYPRARIVSLAGAGHLLPWERPAEVARLILDLWHDEAGTSPEVPGDFALTLASARTSAKTRGILARRAVADDPAYAPRLLNARQLSTLRILADLVVPQIGPAIDLAARVDAQLAAGSGDGWRNDLLPIDSEAYRLALDGLVDIGDLPEAEQKARLTAIVAGDFVPDAGTLSGPQVTAWFEDARVDLVRQWLAHPATMSRVGYDGVSNGGDGLGRPGLGRTGHGDATRIEGFHLLLPSEREGWEPAMEGLR